MGKALRMHLEHLPLLRIQRDLYSIPLGWERFRAYLATMTGGADDIVLPLVGMNPMGKAHVPAMLDELIAFDAEAVAGAAIADAARQLVSIPGRLQVGQLATDDLHGGWTNRYLNEMQLRFDAAALLKRGWAVAPIWTSETWTPENVRAEVLASVYRSAHLQQRGAPKTLGQMMTQEGRAAVFAGATGPTLDDDDLEYTRAVLQPYRATTDYPTIVACLYGDAAARSVGYPAIGLSPRAGYALARVEALHSGVDVVQALRAAAE